MVRYQFKCGPASIQSGSFSRPIAIKNFFLSKVHTIHVDIKRIH